MKAVRVQVVGRRQSSGKAAVGTVELGVLQHLLPSLPTINEYKFHITEPGVAKAWAPQAGYNNYNASLCIFLCLTGRSVSHMGVSSYLETHYIHAQSP